MSKKYFKRLEILEEGVELTLSEVVPRLNFDHRGLVPVVTQDYQSKQVLMLAWMNRAALEQTLQTGRVTYWSRSREELWEKGVTSGHTQELVDLVIDCDGDALLCLVRQQGAACHTNRRSCFYLRAKPLQQKVCVVESSR